ncbi:MAG: cytochrome C, partial [Thauera sp.]
MNQANSLILALALAATFAAPAAHAADARVPIKLPAYKDGAYVHQAPTLDELMRDESLHPELRKV